MRTRFLPVWLLAIALIGAGLWQSNHDAARAAVTPYYVTNNDDSGVGSLRAAVNNATDGDEIRVVAPGPIDLNSTIAITHSITITGPEIAVDPTANPALPDLDSPTVSGQVAIGGINASVNGSVFSIASGKTVVMSHLFITGGIASGTTFSGGTGDPAMGGGIYNEGDLTLNYSTVASNQVHAGNGGNAGGIAYGGGIYSSGTLTLNQSTVDNNGALGGSGANAVAAYSQNAAYGGGIYSTGTTNINSSTISNNTAQGGDSASNHGGAAFGGGIAQYSSGTLNLTNATISANLAAGGNGTTGGNATGGGVAVNNATLNPLNATIADNTVTAGTGGTPTTRGSGLSYSGSAGLTISNSIVAGNTDTTGSTTDFSGAATQNNSYLNGVFTDTLADNGGPTLTIDSANSSVVNAGDNTYSSSLSLDQRGAPRISGGIVDIGAVEHGSAVPTNTIPHITPFKYQILNGTSNFSAAQFTEATDYADAGDELKSVIITYQDFAHGGNGYFQLNGQNLLSGSVISVDDLDNLIFVSNDPNNTEGSFAWQPSDGANPPPGSPTLATVPGYTSDPTITSDGAAGSRPEFKGASGMGGVTNIVYVKRGDTRTISTSWTTTNEASTTDHSTQLSFTLTGATATITPSSTTAKKYSTTASANITMTLDHSGFYSVTSKASDIHGNTSSYHFEFLVDFIPVISNKSEIAAGNNPYEINLGEPFKLPLQGTDEDYHVPKDKSGNPVIHPEPLRFQLDQTSYTPPGGAINNNAKASNIGSFDSTNLSGNLGGGTTLDTTFDWTPTKPGLYGLKVTLTDYWGYVQDFVLALKVNPPTAPAIATPGDQVAQINAPFDLNMGNYTTDSYSGATLTYSANGLPPWANFDTSTGDISGTPHTLGTNTVTVTATDQFGSSASVTFDLTVVNGAPVITDPTEGSTLSAPIGIAYSYPVVATDPNPGDTLAFTDSTSSLPSWAQINATTGEISSINPNGPTLADVALQPTPVTIEVSDGTNTTSVHFFLQVTNGHPPIITTTPQSTYTVDTTSGPGSLSIPFEATDADNPPTPLTFSATGGRGGFGAVTVTPGSPDKTYDSTYTFGSINAGTYTIVVTVADGDGNSDTKSFTIIAGVGNAPTLSVTPTGTINAVTGSPIPTITATAQDADDDEDLTFSLSSNAPTGLTLTQTSFTGVAANTPVQTQLQWTPTTSQAGIHTFDVIVTDSTSFEVRVSVTINVTQSATNNTPTIQNPGTLTATTGQMFNKQIVANDSDGDTLHFSGTNFPTWAHISDNGIISGTPGIGDANKTTSVTVNVTDGKPVGAPDSVSVTFDITVVGQNEPIQVANPGPQTASVGSFFTVSIPANDPNGDPVTYVLTAPAPPTWLTLSPTGVLSGTPTSSDIGTTNVKITVSDAHDAPVTISFPITVSGSGAPTLQATPYAPANPEQVQVNHGYSKMFISHDSEYDPTATQNLTFTATVTTMAGGPVNRPSPDTFMDPTYEAGSTSNGTDAAATFNWTPNKPGTYKVVVTVTDNDGNSTSLTFTIHVSSPPTIRINPTTLSATPGMPLSIPVVVSDPDDHETLTVSRDTANAPFSMTFNGSSTFSDVSGGTQKVAELTYTPQAFEANANYTFNVTVTDSAGLTASQQVTINVGAVNEAPVITSPTSGESVNVVSGHTVSLPVEATDAEGDTLTYNDTGLGAVGLSINSSTGIISGTVSGSGANTVTVTADDGFHVSPTSVTFRIVVGTTNGSPTLDPIADQTVSIGQTLNMQAQGNDPDNDSLTYSHNGTLPTWAHLDTTTGEISGTPASGDTGTSHVTITVTDGYTGSDSQSFALTVTGPFAAGVTSGNGYTTITYTVTNTTGSTISPVVRGSLTGAGYTDNANAFFNASQGFVDDQWANPIIQRQLDPSKDTRIITWTVGSLAPGASATLTISVPINGNTPHGTQLTNEWTLDYGSTHSTVSPKTSN